MRGNPETEARVVVGLPGLAGVVLNGDRVPSSRKANGLEFTVPKGFSGSLELRPAP